MTFKIGEKVTVPSNYYGKVTAVDGTPGKEWITVLYRLGDGTRPSLSAIYRPNALRSGWVGKYPTSERGLGLAVMDLRKWVLAALAEAEDERDRDGRLAYMFVLDQIDEKFEL